MLIVRTSRKSVGASWLPRGDTRSVSLPTAVSGSRTLQQRPAGTQPSLPGSNAPRWPQSDTGAASVPRCAAWAQQGPTPKTNRREVTSRHEGSGNEPKQREPAQSACFSCAATHSGTRLTWHSSLRVPVSPRYWAPCPRPVRNPGSAGVCVCPPRTGAHSRTRIVWDKRTTHNCTLPAFKSFIACVNDESRLSFSAISWGRYLSWFSILS